MTANQLKYWELQETSRSNKSREQETRRSNLAQEKETNRSNLAKETETNRHNLIGERNQAQEIKDKASRISAQNALDSSRTKAQDYENEFLQFDTDYLRQNKDPITFYRIVGDVMNAISPFIETYKTLGGR